MEIPPWSHGHKLAPRRSAPPSSTYLAASHEWSMTGVSWVIIWLVASACFSPSEKYEFVNWDDDSQYMEKWKMFQTTNQTLVLPSDQISFQWHMSSRNLVQKSSDMGNEEHRPGESRSGSFQGKTWSFYKRPRPHQGRDELNRVGHFSQKKLTRGSRFYIMLRLPQLV